MATTADIKNGLCMMHNGKIASVIEFLHVKPGKGPAFVRTKLKEIESGKVLDITFSSGHKIDIVRVERRQYQYLYEEEGQGYHFMNLENYEQVLIPKRLIEKPLFLREGMICEIQFHAEEENPLTVDLPTYIEAEITYTEPGIKGDTATNALKPATIDTGAEIRVPLFIDTGEKVKVNTSTGEYMERVK
ncbi:MAG TPA: elongation factor P [Brumimicrobium sp.]|nr:elongation factor P [Brumimicrobium sp.]